MPARRPAARAGLRLLLLLPSEPTIASAAAAAVAAEAKSRFFGRWQRVSGRGGERAFGRAAVEILALIFLEN